MKNQNEMTLRDFMEPRGGMAALRFMLETEGVKISPQAVHAFSTQAIPTKYTPAIFSIRDRFKIDLTRYIREDKRALPSNNVKKCIYPKTLAALITIGLGKVAAEINIERNKKALFPTNTPKRFNHYSLQKLLTAELSKDAREYFVLVFDLEKEIEADEKAMEVDGLLG